VNSCRNAWDVDLSKSGLDETVQRSKCRRGDA
jgi:hypothetical protein